MSKISLTNLVNLQNENTATGAINSNNLTLQNAIDNTLSRDGTSPNEMESVIDMNSNRIINLPDAISQHEPVTLEQMVNALVDAGDINTGLTGVPVSVAMQPVVAASTIAAARILLGIGVTANSFVFATDYGVKADGVTDDSVALQNAINATHNGTINSGFTGGILVLPPGEIYVGNTSFVINFALNMIGAGQGFTQAALFPTTNAYATLIVSTKTSGNVFEFHTKNPIVLQDFQIRMPHNTGFETGTAIYIDKNDPAITTPLGAYNTVNFCTTLRNITISGAAYGIRCLDIGVMEINHCYVQNYIQIGIWLKNDADTPDNGDSFISHCHTQCAYTDRGIGILMEHMGGMTVHDNKILGGTHCIGITASVAGQFSGEYDIHDNNLEASSTNCIRVTQTGAGANCGGLNIRNNHMNCGVAGSPNTMQSMIAFITNGATNYIFRGKIIGNDILYNNGNPGGHVAIDFETGSDFIIAHNTFAIPASAVGCINFGSLATNNRYVDNGPFTGVTVICNTNAGTNNLFVDRNGSTFATLPAGAKDGSQVYCTDGRALSSSNYFLQSGGSGLYALKIQGSWYASHNFIT